METLKQDLVLYANDLAEFQSIPEGRAVLDAFYSSEWADYDLPESLAQARELGGLPAAQVAQLSKLLAAYWHARNA